MKKRDFKVGLLAISVTSLFFSGCQPAEKTEKKEEIIDLSKDIDAHYSNGVFSDTLTFTNNSKYDLREIELVAQVMDAETNAAAMKAFLKEGEKEHPDLQKIEKKLESVGYHKQLKFGTWKSGETKSSDIPKQSGPLHINVSIDACTESGKCVRVFFTMQ